MYSDRLSAHKEHGDTPFNLSLKPSQFNKTEFTYGEDMNLHKEQNCPALQNLLAAGDQRARAHASLTLFRDESIPTNHATLI